MPLPDPPGADPAKLVKSAADAVGGASVLANRLGVAPSAVSNWRKSGIPAERVPAVARVTGLSFHELRPDLFDAPAAPEGAR